MIKILLLLAALFISAPACATTLRAQDFSSTATKPDVSTLTVRGNALFGSSLTAGAYFGDGSHLSGIAASESNTYTSSKTFTGAVQISSSAVPVIIGVNSSAPTYNIFSLNGKSVANANGYSGISGGAPTDNNLYVVSPASITFIVGGANALVIMPDGGLQLSSASANGVNFLGAWTSWTLSYGGFSANPTGQTARFTRIGKTVIAFMDDGTAGTSNATTYTVTLPVAPGSTRLVGVCYYNEDGAVSSASPAIIYGRSGSTTADVYHDQKAAAWTNSGTKLAGRCMIQYESS